MQFFYLLTVETKRIFCSKITYLFIALCSIAPLFGYVFDTTVRATTKTAIYIGNPLLLGAVIGSVLFAMFTLYELSKVEKNEISALTDTMVSPLTMGICKTLALIFVAIVTTILIMLTQLPYILIKTEEFFRLNDFLTLSIWGLGTNLCFGVIIASAFYHFFKRVDLSFIFFILLLIFSYSEFITDNFILRWANPWIITLSDVYGNDHIFRLVMYSKVFWILIFSALWILSILSIRRHGKGWIKSFFRNSKHNILAPVLSIVIMLSGIAMYVYQPFVDHSGLDLGEWFYHEHELNNNVVLYSQNGDIRFDTKKGTQFSKITYNIENITNEEQTIELGINPGFKIKSVTLNNIDVAFTDLNNDKGGFKLIEIEIPKGQKGDLIIHHEGYRQLTNSLKTHNRQFYISDEYIEPGILLFPYLFIDNPFINDRDWYRDGFEKFVTITLPENMTLVTISDTPEIISENSDGTKTWRTTADGAIYAADFAVHTFDEADLEFYYSSQYEDIIRDSNIIEMIGATVDYCSKPFGALRSNEGLPFKLMQLSEHGSGGSFYGTSFAFESAYLAENFDNPLKGATDADIVAHELIHLWWGGRYAFVNGRGSAWYQDWSPDALDPEWSAEGMTTYTTYRLMKHLKGEEYAQKYYIDVWEEQKANLQRYFYYQNPQYLDILPEKYRINILIEMRGIEWYAVMPLKLLKAEKLLGSEQAFDKAIMDAVALARETREAISYDHFLTAAGLTREDLSLD